MTCVKWVPGSDHQFVSSHRSGHLYIWSSAFTGKTNGPQSFLPHKEVTDAKICMVKPKSKSPIQYRWTVGHGAINAFAFSPDANHIAIASQDGFLRVYDFHKQELYGRMRSYFGGLLCVCWSPDGKYAVTGGEDDLVTVWSFDQKRVVARGEGHKSYVNAVAFDPHMTTLPDSELVSPTSSILPSKETDLNDAGTLVNSLSAKTQEDRSESPTLQSQSKSTLDSSSTHQLNRYLSKVGTELELKITAYRLGSVGQDTQLCLWDLSGDVLKPRRHFSRNRSQMSRHSRPVSIVDPAIDQNDVSSIVPAPTATTTTEATPSTTSQQQPDDPDPCSSLRASKLPNRTSSPGEEIDSVTATTPIGNHIAGNGAKRTSVSSNRDSTPAETGPSEEDARGVGGDKGPSILLPDDGRSSTPSTVSISSEKSNGKKEKKHKKEKSKDKTKAKSVSPKHDKPNGNSNEDEKWPSKKSHRKSLTKVIKFVSNIGSGNSLVQHSYRRAVAAFETCKSDDIAPKMTEVNLLEPLVAKKISNERLTALVFHRDCVITACQEGFIHTWSRPGTELPGKAHSSDEERKRSKKVPAASSVPSNPGVSACPSK